MSDEVRKEVHVTIDPVMDAGFLKTLRLFGTRTCIRYSMEPIKFIKTVYHINTYTDGSIMYPGKTPPALLLNSSYSPSFAAGLLQMRPDFVIVSPKSPRQRV